MLNAALHSSLQSSGMKTTVKKAKTKEELQGSRKSAFSEILEVFAPALGPLKELAPSEEALAELMDAVHSTGSDLKDRPFPDEILKYKTAVRNFVHYVVENGFTVEKNQTQRRGFRNSMPHVQIKVHVQVKVIDKKLEELASAILSGQTTQLGRLAKLNEISGLLVDLTVSGAIKERDD